MTKDTSVFDKIFNRLLGLGIQSQKELAEMLCISPASVWKAKTENRFPDKWVSKISLKYNKSPEWIKGIEEVKSPEPDMPVAIIKGLVDDVAELKIQLTYMEGTIFRLREEIDNMISHTETTPKKSREDYPDQAQEAEKKAVLAS